MAGRLCWLLFVVAAVRYTEGSTLDLYEAVLRRPFLNRGPMDDRDHFGYSVALHDTVDPSTRPSGASLMERLSGARVVVGVPGGTPLNAAVEAPGYVAECPLLPGDCDALRGSGMGNDAFLYDVTGNMNVTYFVDDSSLALMEDKSGMFLGGAMASLGGNFIVCGHRRVVDTAVGSIQGVCYESGRNLSNFQLVELCLDRVSTAGSPRSAIDFFLYNQRLTWCMGGTDIVYANDGSFVAGAPGIQRFFEGGFVFREGDSLQSDDLVGVDDTEEYVGYSVAQGRISHGTEHVVLGAPRLRRGEGRVVIVNRVSGGSGVNAIAPADVVIILTNPGKIGSYFGHAVALVDFTGDGLAEVVVSSPLHFDVVSQPELGAVYIYTNNNGTLSSSVFTQLLGNIPYGRFGHALAAMGDLNFDSYEDLVVSAPFADRGSTEPGTVYVYLGSEDGVRTEPAQVIRGSQLNLMSSELVNLRSFGAALSGSTDIDGNTYNDLVIGAFESRQVFVLRSRTVVVIATNITTNVNVIRITSDSEKECELNGIRYNCFSVGFCLSVRGKGFVSGQVLNISYSLRSDQNVGISPRTILNVREESELNATVLLENGESRCWEDIPVYIKSPDSIYQTPLRPTIVAYIPDEPRPAPSNGNISLTDLQVSRLFSRQDPADSFEQVQGEQTCTDVCETDVQPTDADFALLDNDRRRYNDLFLGFVTRAELSLTLKVPRDESVEDAYGVCLNISAPAGFRYSSHTGFDVCSSSTTIICCVSAPIANGDSVPVQVSFTIQGTNVPTESNITLRGEVTVGFNTVDVGQGSNVLEFPIRVVPSADASISIDVTSNQLVVAGNYTRGLESPPESVGQLGRPFSASFSLKNLGPSKISSGRFLVQVPYRTPCTTNAFLYYITGIERTGILRSGCTVQPPEEEVVDVLQLPRAVSNQTSLDDVPGQCFEGTATLDVNCTANPAWCVRIECNVTDFTTTVEGRIAISGYLDEHFIFYRTLNHYALLFEGDFVVDGATTVEDPNPNPTLTRVVLTNPNVTTPPAPIPWWAIAVPIVVAIIFVIALIVALYLCGFFKRKQSWTPEEDGLTEGEEQQGEGQGEGQGEEGEGQGEGQGEEPVTSKEKDVPSNKELV